MSDRLPTICRPGVCSPRCWAVSAAVAAYAVIFPEDVQAVLVPVGIVLALTEQVHWGAYLLLSVIAVCLTYCWSRRCAASHAPLPPQGSGPAGA